MTDADDLQRQLLTMAGTVMEDASAIMLLDGPDRLVQLQLLALEQAVDDLAAIQRTIQLAERLFREDQEGANE